MKKAKCVFAVIGFNNYAMTDNCVKSLKKYLPNDLDILLYDNGSKKTLSMIAERREVGFFRSENNLGFAGGCNLVLDQIFKQFDTDIVCVLNNDIVINEQFGSIVKRELDRFKESKRLAAMTPLLFKDKEYKIPENFGVLYYRSGLAFQNRTGKVLDKVLLNGAFLFLKTDVCKMFKKRDGYIFQPLFFFNAEDIELCLRMLSRGFKLSVNPRLSVQHLGSKSIKSNPDLANYYSFRNLLWTLILLRGRNILKDFHYIIIGQVILFGISLKSGSPFLMARIYKDTFLKLPILHQTRKKIINYNRKTNSNLNGYIRPGVFPLTNLIYFLE